jgi:H+/gluconate symporter-like permease
MYIEKDFSLLYDIYIYMYIYIHIGTVDNTPTASPTPGPTFVEIKYEFFGLLALIVIPLIIGIIVCFNWAYCCEKEHQLEMPKSRR